MDFIFVLLPWITALHVISVIAWMAALLYLPRLFVYHAQVEAGSEVSETFKVMERRLLKAIGTPAMIASLVFGFCWGSPGSSTKAGSMPNCCCWWVCLLCTGFMRSGVRTSRRIGTPGHIPSIAG